MVSVTFLLSEAEAAGLAVLTEGERLVLRGPRSAERIARSLLEHKQEVLAALAADQPAVRWRTETMRARLPAGGALPFLTARPVAGGAGGCPSCGEPIQPRPDGAPTRCRPCAHAAHLVTAEHLSRMGRQ